MINDIRADTPVQAVLEAENINKRAAMTRLACQVFNKSDGRVLRAYTQFSPQALASLIEAKRKGVFDYGETIRKLSVGAWSFPNDPQAILRALDLAAEGQYEEVDLGSMDLLDDEGRPVIDITRLFPTMKKAPKTGSSKKKKGAKKKAESSNSKKEEEKAAAKKKAEQEEREAAERDRLEREAAEREAQESSESGEELEHDDELTAIDDELVVELAERVRKPVQEHIANLSTNLGEVLEGMHKQTTEHLQAVQAEVDQTSAQLGARLDTIEQNQVVLARALQTFDRNVQQILMYFVDPHMEFEQLPLEGFHLTNSAAETSQAAPPPESEEPDDEPDDEGSSVEEASEHADDEGESGEDTVERYTKEELEAMELPELRDYAESIGCTPARWRRTNVNRIMTEYKRLDDEG